jgi:hypothetical protein
VKENAAQRANLKGNEQVQAMGYAVGKEEEVNDTKS